MGIDFFHLVLVDFRRNVGINLYRVITDWKPQRARFFMRGIIMFLLYGLPSENRALRLNW